MEDGKLIVLDQGSRLGQRLASAGYLHKSLEQVTSALMPQFHSVKLGGLSYRGICTWEHQRTCEDLYNQLHPTV
jgi:hypothetical protein